MTVAKSEIKRPGGLAPRGLSREAAAAYIGVSPGKFDEMVDKCVMPRPKKIGARKIWDLHALDLAFDALPEDNDAPEGRPDNRETELDRELEEWRARQHD